MKSLICFSGLDGAGKTTQYKLLQQYMMLSEQVCHTSNALDHTIEVQRLLVNYVKSKPIVLNDIQIQVLKSAFYMYCDLKYLFESNKHENSIIILDRYVETIYAHAELYKLNYKIIADIFDDIYVKPDYYFFLDLDPYICYQRIVQRAEPLEPHEELHSLIELCGYYKKIAEELGIEIIDANKTSTQIHQFIISRIK